LFVFFAATKESQCPKRQFWVILVFIIRYVWYTDAAHTSLLASSRLYYSVFNLPLSIILYVWYTYAARTSLLASSRLYYTVFNLPISIILYVLYTDSAHTSLLAIVLVYIIRYLIYLWFCMYDTPTQPIATQVAEKIAPCIRTFNVVLIYLFFESFGTFRQR
jgi:hypothetical protein